MEARIDRSDSSSLFLSTPHGDRYLVRRSDVVDIDHPGNVVAGIGLAYVLGGLLLLAQGYAPIDKEDPASGFVAIPRATGW